MQDMFTVYRLSGDCENIKSLIHSKKNSFRIVLTFEGKKYEKVHRRIRGAWEFFWACC